MWSSRSNNDMPTKAPDIVITPDYLGGKDGIAAILNGYYEREINRLPGEWQSIARRFIEEGLIVNGKRVGLAEGLEKSQFGVDEQLLKQLLDSRLIRTESIHLGKIYEVSHDTLVEPILRSFEKRKIREDEIRTQQRLEEERAKRREAEKRRQRAKWLAVAGFSLFFIALIAGILAYRAWQAAERSRLEAEAAKTMAQSEQNKAVVALTQLKQETLQREEAQFKEVMERGKSLLLKSDYVSAAREFRLALSLRPDESEARSQLDHALQKAGVKSKYEQLINSGDALAGQGNLYLVAAREKYRRAWGLHYNDSEAKSKLTALEGRLEKYFIELTNNADILFRAGNGYQEALEFYQKAIEIKTDAAVQEQIRRCQEKLNKQ